FSSRRRHTRFSRDWSSDVCSSDLTSSRKLSSRSQSSTPRQSTSSPMPSETPEPGKSSDEHGYLRLSQVRLRDRTAEALKRSIRRSRVLEGFTCGQVGQAQGEDKCVNTTKRRSTR